MELATQHLNCMTASVADPISRRFNDGSHAVRAKFIYAALLSVVGCLAGKLILFRQRVCPRCNSYVGIVTREPGRNRSKRGERALYQVFFGWRRL